MPASRSGRTLDFVSEVQTKTTPAARSPTAASMASRSRSRCSSESANTMDEPCRAAASPMAATTPMKNGFWRSGMITRHMSETWRRSARAFGLRMYPDAATASCTRRTSSGSTVVTPLTTRDTVADDTPAAAATSWIVTRRFSRPATPDRVIDSSESSPITGCSRRLRAPGRTRVQQYADFSIRALRTFCSASCGASRTQMTVVHTLIRRSASLLNDPDHIVDTITATRRRLRRTHRKRSANGPRREAAARANVDASPAGSRTWRPSDRPRPRQAAEPRTDSTPPGAGLAARPASCRSLQPAPPG